MGLIVILTVHLDAFGLSDGGAVTVRDLDGECHAIETFNLTADTPLCCAAVELSERAAEILAELPEQLRLLTN